MFVIGSRQSLADRWPDELSERTANAIKVLGMMVTVDTFECFHGHAEIACGRPDVGASLHEPRRRCVAECMRSDDAFESGIFDGDLEYRIDPRHRATFPLDDITRAVSFPASQMRQKLSRNRNRRAPLAS